MRLIDADKLKPDVKTFTSAYSEELTEFYSQEAIENAPTVDAEPVRHGEWTPINLYCNHAREFKCSACGESVYYDYYTRFCEYDFCPNCGAKMDGMD